MSWWPHPACCQGIVRATAAASLIIKHHCQSLSVLQILQYVSILRVQRLSDSREKIRHLRLKLVSV